MANASHLCALKAFVMPKRWLDTMHYKNGKLEHVMGEKYVIIFVNSVLPVLIITLNKTKEFYTVYKEQL